MEFFDVIKNRRSVRKFKKKDVPDELVERILNAAKLAPSAGNLQRWFFVVVKDKKVKKDLSRVALFQKQVKDAPIVIVSCADTKRSSLVYGKRGRDLYSVQDATIATQNIFLTVTAVGLGACWVGAFREGKVRKILSLKENLRPVVIMPIGYPDRQPKKKSRRPIEKISKFI